MYAYQIDQETCNLIQDKCNTLLGTSYTATTYPNGDIEFLPDNTSTMMFVNFFLTQLRAHEHEKGKLLDAGPLRFFGRMSN